MFIEFVALPFVLAPLGAQSEVARHCAPTELTVDLGACGAINISLLRSEEAELRLGNIYK